MFALQHSQHYELQSELQYCKLSNTLGVKQLQAGRMSCLLRNTTSTTLQRELRPYSRLIINTVCVNNEPPTLHYCITKTSVGVVVHRSTSVPQRSDRSDLPQNDKLSPNGAQKFSLSKVDRMNFSQKFTLSTLDRPNFSQKFVLSTFDRPNFSQKFILSKVDRTNFCEKFTLSTFDRMNF